MKVLHIQVHKCWDNHTNDAAMKAYNMSELCIGKQEKNMSV